MPETTIVPSPMLQAITAPAGPVATSELFRPTSGSSESAGEISGTGGVAADGAGALGTGAVPSADATAAATAAANGGGAASSCSVPEVLSTSR